MNPSFHQRYDLMIISVDSTLLETMIDKGRAHFGLAAECYGNKSKNCILPFYDSNTKRTDSVYVSFELET